MHLITTLIAIAVVGIILFLVYREAHRAAPAPEPAPVQTVVQTEYVPYAVYDPPMFSPAYWGPHVARRPYLGYGHGHGHGPGPRHWRGGGWHGRGGRRGWRR